MGGWAGDRGKRDACVHVMCMCVSASASGAYICRRLAGQAAATIFDFLLRSPAVSGRHSHPLQNGCNLNNAGLWASCHTLATVTTPCHNPSPALSHLDVPPRSACCPTASTPPRPSLLATPFQPNNSSLQVLPPTAWARPCAATPASTTPLPPLHAPPHHNPSLLQSMPWPLVIPTRPLPLQVLLHPPTHTCSAALSLLSWSQAAARPPAPACLPAVPLFPDGPCTRRILPCCAFHCRGRPLCCLAAELLLLQVGTLQPPVAA